MLDLDDRGQLALRHVLDRVEASSSRPRQVSEVIQASWRRAAAAGLRPDEIHAPYDEDVDDDSRLHWAAAPAMSAVGADLDGVRSALLLVDRRVHVIARWTRTARIGVQMDAFGAAPGFFCDETLVGTNSIGMAARTRGAALVRGFEHFADAFTHVTCASRAVVDPFTGQLLGVVNLTIADPAPWELMSALVGRIVHETQQRLLDRTSSTSSALFERFLEARRRTKGPVAAVDGTSLFTNAAGSRYVASSDREALWAWARAHLAAHGQPRGPSFAAGATCEGVHDGRDLVGALVRFAPSPGGAPPEGNGWVRLTDAERSVAELVAAGYTNREAATKLFLSPHTVDYHLRHIFRKLDIDSRVQLARVLDQRVGASSPGDAVGPRLGRNG